MKKYTIFSAPLPHLPHLSNLHGSTPPLTLSPPPLYLQPESYPGMHPEQHTGMHPEQYPVMHPDLQADYSVPSPPGSNHVFLLNLNQNTIFENFWDLDNFCGRFF